MNVDTRAVYAHEGEKHTMRAPTSAETPSAGMLAGMSPKQRAARLFFSDRKLITQSGEEFRFYSDVLRDKVVLINFIFSQCTDSCPAQSARVAATQPLIGDTLGREVSLISISVDPEHDTAKALADYAARFGAAKGWLFLTGTKADVGEVVRSWDNSRLGATRHPTLLIVGKLNTGHGYKLHPDTAPKEIA